MGRYTTDHGGSAMRAGIFALVLAAIDITATSSYAFPPFQGGAFIDGSGTSCGYEVNTYNGVQTTFVWCEDGAQYSSSSRVGE